MMEVNEEDIEAAAIQKMTLFMCKMDNEWNQATTGVPDRRYS